MLLVLQVPTQQIKDTNPKLMCTHTHTGAPLCPPSMLPALSVPPRTSSLASSFVLPRLLIMVRYFRHYTHTHTNTIPYIIHAIYIAGIPLGDDDNEGSQRSTTSSIVVSTATSVHFSYRWSQQM